MGLRAALGFLPKGISATIRASAAATAPEGTTYRAVHFSPIFFAYNRRRRGPWKAMGPETSRRLLPCLVEAVKYFRKSLESTYAAENKVLL